MKRKRIAVIGIKGYPYVYGGYETLIASLAIRLKEKNTEVTIYCHRSLFPERPPSVNGIRLIYLPAIETTSLSQLSHSFLSTLHAGFCAYDSILYVNLANAPFGWWPRLFGIKTVINVDGLEWLRPKWKGFGSRYYRFCASLVKHTFNTIVTDAREMQKTYSESFNCPSVMIPYGAEKETKTDEQLLERYNLKQDDFYLVVGRMIPDNNLDIILKEFLMCRTEKKLVVIGDDIFRGVFSKIIQEHASQSNRIILTGYITNYIHLTTLYKTCYAYIHGHEFGGTNPTLVLALSEGCRILALSTRFNKEVLDNSENGVYFSKDPGSLAEIMEKTEQNEYLGAPNWSKTKGPERVENHYNWQKIAGQYLEIL